jgi:hypothetical protein
MSLYQVGERGVRVAGDVVDFTADNGAPAAAETAEEVNLSVHMARLKIGNKIEKWFFGSQINKVEKL